MKDSDKLFPFLRNIMIPKPSRETWVGFLVACGVVLLFILSTVLLAKIGG